MHSNHLAALGLGFWIPAASRTGTTWQCVCALPVQESISGLGGSAAAIHLSTAAVAGGDGSAAICNTAPPPAEGPAAESSQQ